MQRHTNKHEFNFIAATVMVLEVAAFFVFIFGALGAIYGTYSGIETIDFILMGFGGMGIAFLLLTFAEFLQLLMKIEYNTRKSIVIPKNNGKGLQKKMTRKGK